MSMRLQTKWVGFALASILALTTAGCSTKTDNANLAGTAQKRAAHEAGVLTSGDAAAKSIQPGTGLLLKLTSD